jgi:hypothetical protein
MSQDKGILPVKVTGWVQGTKRRLPDCPRCEKMTWFDAERQDYVCRHCGLDSGIVRGPITQQFAQQNLLTRDFFRMEWFNNGSINSLYIFISNDDTGVNEFKTIIENTMNGTAYSTAVAPVKNTVSEFYTYSHTFAAPGSARIIRQVGMGERAYYSVPAGSWKMQALLSATELSSEIEQGTGETFEVVYKYQFSEVVAP